MRHGLVIKYDDVAAYLANEGSDIQAKFFSIFAQELRKNCQTHYHTEMQMQYILHEMKDEDKDTMLFHYKDYPGAGG